MFAALKQNIEFQWLKKFLYVIVKVGHTCTKKMELRVLCPIDKRHRNIPYIADRNTNGIHFSQRERTEVPPALNLWGQLLCQNHQRQCSLQLHSHSHRLRLSLLQLHSLHQCMRTEGEQLSLL